MPTSKRPDKPANLDDAFAAHHRWKMELRHAVERGERLDIAVIKNPGACELGRWLKSEDAMQYAHLTEFKELVKKHDEFHAVTALVASVVNGKDLPLANAVINGSNHFSRASLEVGMAIQALRNAVA